MPNWLWVLTVIPALGFLVFVHELGHFLTALRMGIKVEEFGFGYPPRIATLTHWRGVPVTLNWLPLGGFVRMAGEEGNFDVEGSLAQAPPWKKIPVMAAGAIMNILAAIVIFGIVGMYEPLGPVTVTNVSPGSPAEQAKLQAQDVILEVDGQPVDSTRELQAMIKERQGQATKLDVQRSDPQSGDTTFNVTVTPANGVIGVGITVPTNKVTDHHYDFNPLHALSFGLEQTWLWAGRMIAGVGLIIGSFFGATQTQATGGFAGPVGIARITGQVAREGGLISYLNLTALISVNLAVFNLLPIPALDGSRIVFALVEWVRRGKRVPPEKEAMVHAVGMIALLGLMLLVTFSDVRNIWLGRDAFGG
jgi:regulator of sigma E protease